MTELCEVKRVKRGTAYVELVRSDKCDGCNMCAFNKKKSMVVPTVCEIAVEVGQTVVVEMPTRSVGAAALLIYALPLLFMVIGVLIGLLGGVWLQVGLCAAGLAIGLLCAFFIDKAYRKKAGVLPKVLRVVEKSETTDAAEHTEPIAPQTQSE